MAEPGVPLRCARCGTELSPSALSCLVCGALVHAAELKDLAATAERQAADGALSAARDSWQRALALLPERAQQHEVVRARIADLTLRIGHTPAAQLGEPPDTRPWWKRGAAAIAAAVLFALGKLKFLLLGLGKATTLLSMFAFFGLYWSAFGWPLALGFVISIYIHEMGHVWEIRRQGLEAGAPLFIPGLGALIMLKTHIDDPRVDAKIGLAGPVWGLGAGIASYAIYLGTGNEYWKALAHLTGFINLFNLLPFWQLDGSRAFHALSTWQRWVIVGAIAVAYLATDQGILLLIGLVAVYRAFQKAVPEGDNNTLGTFMILLGALSWMSALKVAGQ